MKTYYVAGLPFSDELYHHGIKGQKWGVRRFQNLDRTWTEEGKKRYAKGLVSTYQKIDGSLTPAGKEREKAFQNKWFSKPIDEFENYMQQKLGNDQYSKITQEWEDVLWKTWDSNSKRKVLPESDKRLIMNSYKKEDALHKRSSKIITQIRDSPTLDKDFERIRSSLTEDEKWAIDYDEERLKKNPNSQEDKRIYDVNRAMAIFHRTEAGKQIGKQLDNNRKQRIAMEDQMFERYKSLELKKLLQKYPADQQEVIFDWLRFNWWNYE